jgi:hypothetical protein
MGLRLRVLTYQRCSREPAGGLSLRK